MTAFRFEETTDPAAAGLDPDRWARVPPLPERLCGDAVAAICVGRGSVGLRAAASGSVESGGPTATADTAFAVASLTKPVVAGLALLAVERGELSLGDRVAEFLPPFRSGKKRAVRVRHLLTHTAGLPDLLPDDRELRAARAPRGEFLRRAAETPLTCEPGRAVSYSSLGFAVLWSVLDVATSGGADAALRNRVFDPLGMTATRLGGPDRPGQEIAEVRPEPGGRAELQAEVWNAPYWRETGLPWGGLVSTAGDLGRFCAAWATGGGGVWGPATVAAAMANALEPMRQVPEADRRCRPWGLGWRRVWPAHAAYFGDLLPGAAFGHWGLTGCVMWVEPGSRSWAVILTAVPQDPGGGLCGRLSNAIVSSFVPGGPLAVSGAGE